MHRITDRHLILTCMLLSVLCLGYFYLVDRAIFSSASFSPIFDLLLVIYDKNSAWLVVALCFWAAAWSGSARFAMLGEFLDRRRALFIVASVALLAVAAVFVYHDYPLAMDEYAAVFQSKIFAMGHIVARLPPHLINSLIAPGFNGHFIFASPRTGHAIEGYWPGFALLLAPFQMIRMPWLCNPLLAGLALLLIHRIVLDITHDRSAAGFSMLFAMASGAFVANAISYYSMQAHLTANLLFAWLLLAPNRARALAAGAVGSLALVLHNPMPHAVFAFPWIIALAVDRRKRAHLPYLVLGYLPIGVALGFGWLVVKGQIGADIPGLIGLAQTAKEVFRWPNVAMVNMKVAALAKLWVWAMPGLLLLALIGLVRWFDDRNVRLLALSAACTFVAYLFVDLDQGHGWGYRYFQSAWGTLPILAACAITGKSASPVQLKYFAAAAAVLSLSFLVPFQLHQIDSFISAHLAQVPAPTRPGNDVYFIRPAGGYYIADMIQNDPALRSKDLMAISQGAGENAALIHRYWPTATKVNQGPFGEEWNLGPVDRRAVNAGSSSPRFVFARAPLEHLTPPR